MPWTDKQTHLFQAVAHGWKPTQKPTKLSPEKAKELLAEGKVKAQRKLVKGLPPSPT